MTDPVDDTDDDARILASALDRASNNAAEPGAVSFPGRQPPGAGRIERRTESGFAGAVGRACEP